MKAITLLGTLKKSGLSNTATLSEFLSERMEAAGIESETIKLVDHRIPPGTQSDMGEGDGWPAILEKIDGADIVIFATPIWWDGHSSLIQRVIERMDAIHDDVMEGKPSMLDGKVGGIVITGDSDGAQHIIANVGNFFNAIGLLFPPYATLSVLWDRQAKGKEPTREELMKKYEKDYGDTADKMVKQLKRYVG